jgi:hypothetical protein
MHGIGWREGGRIPKNTVRPARRSDCFSGVGTATYHACFRFWSCKLVRYTGEGMDVEQIIAEIESLERAFAVPDPRPLSVSDISAANRRHDEKLAGSPWFKLWQRYGLCCRAESPVFRPGEIDS